MKKAVFLITLLLLGILLGAVLPYKFTHAIFPPRILSVPASAFHPGNDTARFNRGFTVLINRGERMWYVAPVYLPPGATISRLEFDTFDGWRDGGINLKLLASATRSAVLGEIETNPEWDGGKHTWSMDIAPHQVNERWGYTLYLILPEVRGADLRFSGARIFYGTGGSDVGRREQ